MAAAAESIASTMTNAERERADAIMRGWFAFNAEALELETACNKTLDSIGRKAADVIAKEIGVDHDLIGGRNEEFGRLLADAVRTYHMQLPYKHQMNDALIKEQLKTIEYVQARGIEAEYIEHDVHSMKEIFEERRYWIEQTGDIALALDAITTPTCFRNLTVAEGIKFNDDRTSISWISPYKRILEKGWLRNIWTGITEKYIHEKWTIPRMEGYQHHFGVRFVIDPWNEESRVVRVTVHSAD
jgi:hypothetical protein